MRKKIKRTDIKKECSICDYFSWKVMGDKPIAGKCFVDYRKNGKIYWKQADDKCRKFRMNEKIIKSEVTREQIDKALTRFIETYNIIDFEGWLGGLGVEIIGERK